METTLKEKKQKAGKVSFNKIRFQPDNMITLDKHISYLSLELGMFRKRLTRGFVTG